MTVNEQRAINCFCELKVFIVRLCAAVICLLELPLKIERAFHLILLQNHD